MSDATDAPDLVGIARSIDALFSGAPRPSARDSVRVADLPLESAAENAAEHAFDEEAQPSFVDAPLDERPPDPGTAPAEAEVVAEPAPLAGARSESDGDLDPDFVPTALDHAVDAYVAGDRGQADEIERIANQMLDDRELDPVARSVRRLALAAGDPPDDSIRGLAIGIASPVVLGRLAAHMGAERDEGRRGENQTVCRTLGAPMGVAIRDDLAESTDRHARRIHCDALVAMGPAGREIIDEMAVDENRFLVRNAVAILGDIGGDDAVKLVTSALANPDARVRREALRSLARIGDEESGELVFGLLDDSDQDVRIAAAVAAGELGVERGLRSIIKMLDETKDADQALPLIRALGQLGDPGAVPSIEKWAVPRRFSKPRTDVRITAYRALHRFGTPHARRLLNQALDDKETEVKSAVKEILGMR
ncbi:MAG: HEAT repeat domain-containing protein [Gemmatimonadota bacterium]|nr:HEAT repeat domain-containing protein [Gemmatimonadota bacterium]